VFFPFLSEDSPHKGHPADTQPLAALPGPEDLKLMFADSLRAEQLSLSSH
jgi:hypothetical protein